MFTTDIAQNWYNYFANLSCEYLQSQEGVDAIHRAKAEIAQENRQDAHKFGNEIMAVMYRE